MVGPEARDLPLDERDLPAHLDAIELLAPAAAHGDELTGDSFVPGLGDSAEGGALEPRPVRELDEGLLEPPSVDGHRLLGHVLQAEIAHLAGDVSGGCALFGRPGHAKPKRVRPERLEPLDDAAQVVGRDLDHGRPSSRPSSVSRTSGPSRSRS